MANIKIKKSWEEVKDKLTPDPEKMDANAEIKAVDVMLKERTKAIKTSRADREWEKDRKKEWQENKKYYLKDLESKKPKDPVDIAVSEIKNGGEFNYDVHPVGGYILTKLEKLPRQTASGIYLADVAEEEPNTARVLEVGKGYYADSGAFINTEVVNGQLVMFRKFAGMNVKVKGIDYLMLHFQDIIAVINA